MVARTTTYILWPGLRRG